LTSLPIYNPVTAAIDAHHESQYTPWERDHLGCSQIGHKCDRYIWLKFRFALERTKEQIEDRVKTSKKRSSIRSHGQLLRLFRRGHMEEFTVREDLEAIGCVIDDERWVREHPRPGVSWNDKSQQIGVDLGKFLSGSVDGVIHSGLPGAPKTPHLLEVKTSGTAPFHEVRENGVREAKFQHFVQMQLYMHALGLKRALYLVVCKETDELYAERVEYDREIALAFIARGHWLAALNRVPDYPEWASASWWECKMCEGWKQCWGGETTDQRNCRTCVNVFPDVDNRRFMCRLNGNEATGLCDEYEKRFDL